MELNTIINLVVAAIVVGSVLVLVGVGGYRSKVNRNEKGIDTISYDIKRLIEKVGIIEGKLGTIGKTVESNSLLSLTKKGQRVSKDMNAYTLIRDHYKTLRDKVLQGNHDMNPYDIGEKSLKIAQEEIYTILSDTEINTIKDVAFRKGMTISDMSILLAIILRDEILKENEKNA